MHFQSALSSLLVLAASSSLTTSVHSEIQPSRLNPAQKRIPIAAPSNVIGIKDFGATAGQPAGVQKVSATIQNYSKSSVTWIDWQLKAKSGTKERFLGAGSITVIDGNLTQTISVEFVPASSDSQLQFDIDTRRSIETNNLIRVDDTKTLSVPGAATPSTLSVADLDPARAASDGANHSYTPRSGMTGCSMAAAPVGTNSLAVNMTCTAAAQGEVELFKNFSLRNGWKVNGVAVGGLGGGSVEYHRLPNAGSSEPYASIGIKGAPGSMPLFFVNVELYGPAGSSPY
ncbi:MAG TPA: hypothetical protein VHM70_07425 [Polyangiaceae bacterium]|jgi:hypothetical protein|nr:hypothetical protein [Polyangiaceae bacterium]